jgi:hypothetical protein
MLNNLISYMSEDGVMVSVVDRDPQGSELFAVSEIIGPDPVSGWGRKLYFSERT